MGYPERQVNERIEAQYRAAREREIAFDGGEHGGVLIGMLLVGVVGMGVGFTICWLATNIGVM